MPRTCWLFVPGATWGKTCSAARRLGLSIAQDIVACYAGRLAFSRSRNLGGLQVTILLPPATAGSEQPRKRSARQHTTAPNR